MALHWPFKLLGSQDADEGGAPFVEVDASDRTIRSGTKLNVKNLAAAYTFVAEDSGKVFIATAALTLTLPAVSAAFSGCHGRVVNGADTDFVLAATAGEMVFKNDLAANSVSYATAGEKIGSGFDFFCDGSKWYVLPLAEEAVTITVVT
jgi:hypothetical protein